MSHTDGDGRRTIRMADIFTEDQIADVWTILADAKNEADATDKLRPYLIKIRDQLEAKGVLPEYAAYALPYWLMNRRVIDTNPASGNGEESGSQ